MSCLRRALLPILLLAPLPLAAQGVSYPSTAIPFSDPAERLAGYLRTLAAAPRDIEALTGAGRAALDVGDANAAIGFYARADGVRPRDGRIKAGLATALLRMGKAKDALRLYGDAVSLGVPEADIAGERGLAWDLRGEPKKAQRDYQLALAAGPNDEITRRYALSLGIAGDQPGGVQMLVPLLNRRDTAAWRTRAFILALNGDATGAETIAASAMPMLQAQAMRPFFQRLAALDTEEKARAVHLGEMPSDGTRYTSSELAGYGGARSGAYRPETVRDDGVAAVASGARPTSAWLRNRQRLLKQFSPRNSAAALNAEAAAALPPVATASADPQPAIRTLPAAPPPRLAGVGRTIADTQALPVQLALTVAPPPKKPLAAERDAAEAAPARSRAESKRPVDARPKKTAAELRKEKDAAGKAKAAKADPERVWVQVAGGANKSDLPKAWAGVKAKAPDLLKGRAASTAKVRATNRVLIGPFKSESEAQALVNKLGGKGLSGFIVTTGKGEKVEKLDAKG